MVVLSARVSARTHIVENNQQPKREQTTNKNIQANHFFSPYIKQFFFLLNQCCIYAQHSRKYVHTICRLRIRVTVYTLS